MVDKFCRLRNTGDSLMEDKLRVLAQTIKKFKSKAGLRDVKFLLDATADDASLEEALEELKRFDEAIAKNNGEPFDFGDLRWKD